jgi:myosin heavy subunit
MYKFSQLWFVQDVNISECHKIDIELANALEQVLNAFGGAKTLKNDGATRHGYAMELHYSG